MNDEEFETWAIVDLFGHTRVAGKVTEQEIGGCSFVRVDIPNSTDPLKDDSFRTELYGQKAIYAIRFVSEDVARLSASQNQCAPISAYDFPPHVRQAMLEHQELDAD